MTKKNNNISEILGNAKTSKWLDAALQWKKNAAWLRHSQNIALDILERLDEMDLKQKDLANKLEVSPQIVSRWLKGKENFSLETISRLEAVLSIQLIRREEKKQVIEVLVTDFTEDYEFVEQISNKKTTSEFAKGEVIHMRTQTYELVSNTN